MRYKWAEILFVIYIIASTLRWHFQFWTGVSIIRIGYYVREWIEPELSHTLFIKMLRWTYWQPKWVPNSPRDD